MKHSHTFRFPPPNGPASLGVCTGCGDEREAVNFIDAGYNGWSGPEGKGRRKGLEDNAAALHFANLQVHEHPEEE